MNQDARIRGVLLPVVTRFGADFSRSGLPAWRPDHHNDRRTNMRARRAEKFSGYEGLKPVGVG